MQLKDVYDQNFLKSFGDKADKIGEIELDGLAVDIKKIVETMGYRIDDLRNYASFDDVPDDVIVYDSNYPQDSYPIAMAADFSRQLWREDPDDTMIAFLQSAQRIERFMYKMLMPEDLIKMSLAKYMKANNVTSIDQVTPENAISEMSKDFKVPARYVREGLRQIGLIA